MRRQRTEQEKQEFWEAVEEGACAMGAALVIGFLVVLIICLAA